MKQYFESWLSIPVPKGAKYSQTLPPDPPVVVLLAVSFTGGRGAFCAYGVGAVGGTSGNYVSFSRASARMSVHISIAPYNVTLVFLTYSKSNYIA
jgi:hypothetical protein